MTVSQVPTSATATAEPEAERQPSSVVEAPVPLAPVPLASRPQTRDATEAEHAAETETDSPLSRLRKRDTAEPGRDASPASGALIQFEPRDLPGLLACSDWNIRYLAADTKPHGKLMTLLKGAFEADWFKAKSCLVFGKWPAATGKPRFSHESSLELMSALTVLRGEVHKTVMPEAQKQVKSELAKRAAQLTGNTRLAGRLTSKQGIAPAEQVQYKGSVGADTVTSDVDVSTGGVNSEMAVRAYNEAFRKLLGVAFDPGTVFDLNVYAMDFVHGKTDTGEASFKVNAENAEDPGADNAAARDEQQEIWALVHVARYLPDDDEWALLVERTVEGVGNPKEKERQQRLHDKARSIAKGFEARLRGMMDHLEGEVDRALKVMGPSAWGEDNEHYTEGALRMRAANRLYEDKLLQVKDLRSEITELRKSGATPDRLKRLVAELTNALSMAQLYANEVYGSGGGTVHAVFGMQTRKKLEAELEKKQGKKVKVKVEMSPAQWMETFTDNLGDVLKDYEHYGAHAVGEADYWYAAFKMGKYVDRMLDAVPNLAETGLITEGDRIEIESSRFFTELTDLARYHREEKDGPSKNDPQKLKDHAYFKTIGPKQLESLKWAAMEVGVMVRTKAGNKRTPTPPPTGDGPPTATPTPSGPPDSPTGVLADLQAAVTKAGADIESVEQQSER